MGDVWQDLWMMSRCAPWATCPPREGRIRMLRRILVPLDGTPLAEWALPYAAELARAVGGSLVLLCPADARRHVFSSERLDQDANEDVEVYLRRQVGRFQADGLA